jgi:hypothetical protein
MVSGPEPLLTLRFPLTEGEIRQHALLTDSANSQEHQ